MDKYILQNQKIPESQKTKEWDIAHVQAYIDVSNSSGSSLRKQEQLKCWNYYYGYDTIEKQQKNDVTVKPYGFHLGLEYQIYPLVSNVLEQMIGEWMTKPIKRQTYVINKDARAKKLDEMFSIVTESILRETNKELEGALGFAPETPNPEIELPEDIDTFIEEGTYKTTSEKVSNLILEQVLEVKNNKDKLKDLLTDLLVQDEVIATIDEEDGHPCINRESIFETDMDWDPSKEIQKDPQYIIKTRYLSFNEVLNSFDLSDKEEDLLRSYTGFANSNASAGEGFDDPRNNNAAWFRHVEDIMRVRCVEMQWISKRKIRAKVTINKHTGKEIYALLKDDYIAQKKDDIKTVWADYKRKIVMVGPDLVLEHGPMNERYGKIDNPKKDTILCVGLRRNNFLNAPMQSAAKKLLQLQDFASELLFEWRLSQRRNNGRVLVYDSAQIPKQFLKSGAANTNYENALNRVMHHVKKDQFLVINSQDRNSRHAFNQFTSMDMSSKGMVNDIVAGLALIEQLGAKFVGVSQERGGAIDQYQSATATERAVIQSSARTEIYISPFESFLEEVCMKILMKGKYVYEENEVVPFILGDLNTKFMQVYPDYHQDDVGVSIASNYKDQKKKQIIDGAVGQALSTAQDPELIFNLIEALEADTATESKEIYKRAVKSMVKMREENQKAMQQAEQTRVDGELQMQEKEHGIKREGYDKDILIAEIKANNATINAAADRSNAARMKLADLENNAMKSAPNT